MSDYMNNNAAIEAAVEQVNAIGDRFHERIRRDEYIYVALPFLMFRRFDEVLGSEMTELVDYARQHDDLELKDLDERIRARAPFETYNASGLSLAKLASESSKQDVRFRDYLNGFSVNVRRLLASLRFHSIFPSLVRFVLLGDVCRAYADPELKIDAATLPAPAYEELLKRLVENASAASPNGDCGIDADVINRMVRATGEIHRITPGNTASLDAFEATNMRRTDPELLQQKLEEQKKAAQETESAATETEGTTETEE
ncbi:MAG: hypothetical protein J6T47_05685 [Lachnospiraceae bacterium]|nr:hypothetical protein [Lachnospiraceae bacterium]